MSVKSVSIFNETNETPLMSYNCQTQHLYFSPKIYVFPVPKLPKAIF